MRCFEAMGCGALLVSDAGNYPEGMVADETIVTYEPAEIVSTKCDNVYADWTAAKEIADNGRRRIGDLYTKERQWALVQKVRNRGTPLEKWERFSEKIMLNKRSTTSLIEPSRISLGIAEGLLEDELESMIAFRSASRKGRT